MMNYFCNLSALIDTILYVRFTCFVRALVLYATGATFNTGDWLGLSRQGFAPCKTHQAFPGALPTWKPL